MSSNKIIDNLALIFNESDNVYVGGTLQDEGGYSNPRLVEFNHLSTALAPEHQFFSINPISFDNRNIKADGSTGSYRASINVATFKNFLLESDTLPLELQHELVPYLATHIPIRLATFSGSKSVHMIISVADTLFNSQVKEPIQLYKQIWEGLCEKAENLAAAFLLARFIEAPPKIFDRATKDPSRLSRLPGALRNGIEQSVIYTGGLVAADELLVLAAEARLHQYDSANTTVDPSLDVASFERRLRNTQSLNFLCDKLEYPDRWTSSANMYTEMFKYALWCVDATSVSFNVLDSYLTRRVYPSIVAKGYPRNPRAGVLAAYEYKGLL